MASKKIITTKITAPAPKATAPKAPNTSSGKSYLVYPSGKGKADTISTSKAADLYKSAEARGLGSAKANFSSAIKNSVGSTDSKGNTYRTVKSTTSTNGSNDNEMPSGYNPVAKARQRASGLAGNKDVTSGGAVSKGFSPNSKDVKTSAAVNNNSNVKSASVAISKKIKGKS